MNPFIAVTDKGWFDFLAAGSDAGRVDEVNFWSPRAQRPMKQMRPGETVFFRLKAPHNAIAGYGFFAHFAKLDLELAWETFGAKNGAATRARLAQLLSRDAAHLARDPSLATLPLACTILRDASFWPHERWIAWGEAQGWSTNIVQGRTEDDSARASRLLGELAYDSVAAPEDLAPQFQLVDADEREFDSATVAKREGQGAFRARLLDAYERRCAITGEHTEPVLDAAHVQPYLGPRSNHVQNGLLLTKEFHTLFDKGLVTITPGYRVRVSRALRERWNNGKRYYEYDGRELTKLPTDASAQPSRDALRWHNVRRFIA